MLKDLNLEESYIKKTTRYFYEGSNGNICKNTYNQQTYKVTDLDEFFMFYPDMETPHISETMRRILHSQGCIFVFEFLSPQENICNFE